MAQGSPRRSSRHDEDLRGMNARDHARREDGRDRRHAKHDVAPVPDALALLRVFRVDIAETSSVFARRSGSLSGLQPARSQPAPWSSRSGNKRAMQTSRSTLCRTVLKGDVTVLIRTLEPTEPRRSRRQSGRGRDKPPRNSSTMIEGAVRD